MNRSVLPRTSLMIACLVVVLLATASTARAQVVGGNSYPSLQYFAMFAEYYQGEYRDAYKEYSKTPSALKFGSQRYLDSACHWTMAGECQFHTGNYAQALELYEQSLNLYLDYVAQGWQGRIVPPNINNALPNALQRTNITWGQPARAFQIASIPDDFQVWLGDPNAVEKVLTKGGVYNPAELRAINVVEIMRCTAIAMHRRRWIKGAISKFEPLSTKMVTVLEAGYANDGSLLGAMNGTVLGMAFASIDDFDNAKRTLEQSLQFGGGFDHPLTPLALLELAQINFQLEDARTAAHFALEASYSAAIFNQYDVLEESLSFAAMLHMATQQKGPYPPLQPAIAWCTKNRARLPQVSLALRLAECYSEAGDAVSSARLVADASRTFSARTGFGAGNLSGRANYLAAENLFLDGKYDDGRAQLQKAIADFASASRWLFQLDLVERYVLSNSISSRHAQTLYGLLLRDPTEREWRSEPIEAISFLASPHLPSIDRWLQITLADRDFKQTLKVAELFRRHRFFSEMPLGGRDLAFRWMMHAPAEALTKTAAAQRIDFFTRYPAYKDVSDKAEQLRFSLLGQPLQYPPDSDERKNQIKSFVELMKTCQLQEALLASIALRREPAEMVFPPQMDVEEVQRQMEPNQTVLYVVGTANQYFFLELTQRGIRLISQHSVKDLGTAMTRFFRDTQLDERQLSGEALDDPKWKTTSAELAKGLLPGLTLEMYGEALPELVIIPSGLTWYLPFEALSIENPDKTTAYLSEKTRIRYSPTLGLAITPQRPTPRWKRTAFFTDKISDVADNEFTTMIFDKVQKEFPDVTSFPEKLEIPSALFGSICDEFVVWTEMGRMPPGGPFALNLVQKDKGQNGSNLGSWLPLPWAGAEHVILPLYESEGANGVRNKNPGDEMFLTTLGLLASGAKTVMMSRWPTGGKSSLDFSQEYWKATRTQKPIDAMQTARKFVQNESIDYEHEFRIKKPKDKPERKGLHPLLWGGYILIDVPAVRDPSERIDSEIGNPEIKQGEDVKENQGGDAEAKKDGDPLKADEMKKDAPPDAKTPPETNEKDKGDLKTEQNKEESGKKKAGDKGGD